MDRKERIAIASRFLSRSLDPAEAPADREEYMRVLASGVGQDIHREFFRLFGPAFHQCAAGRLSGELLRLANEDGQRVASAYKDEFGVPGPNLLVPEIAAAQWLAHVMDHFSERSRPQWVSAHDSMVRQLDSDTNIYRLRNRQ